LALGAGVDGSGGGIDLTFPSKWSIKEKMGTVAKSLAEHWHWKEMQHRAFDEFTATTKCCTVTTKFLGEIAHLEGKESDAELNAFYSVFGLNRKELGGYEAKLSQFFHPANVTSIWKSIVFVLLFVLTFGIYYAVSATFLWRSFHRGEDALHKTLTNTSGSMEADSDLANALLLSRILLLTEKLFKCYPLPSKSTDEIADKAAGDEWSNKDLRFFLVSNETSLLDDDPKTDGGEQSPPNDADGAMRKFLSLYDTSQLKDFKPAYEFRDEVKQNFSVHAQDFETLCKLIGQRGALQKLGETKKTALSDAESLFKSQAMACDKLELGDDKFLLRDVKILLDRIRKGEDVAPDKANLKTEFNSFRDAILKRCQFSGSSSGETEFLKFFTRKSSNTSPITADEFLACFLDGLLAKIVEKFAKCASLGLEACAILSFNIVRLEKAPELLYVDSCYKLNTSFNECVLCHVTGLQTNRRNLEQAIIAECNKHYESFKNLFKRKRQELEASPEYREKVAAIEKSTDDEIRKTFLPSALGISAAAGSGQSAK
jgi:hypothetical protein